MSTLWISAGLKVQENQSAQQAKAALLDLQQASEKEPGCVYFHVLEHKGDPHAFTLWEEWKSEADLVAHFELAHTKSFIAKALTEIVYIEKLIKHA